jgi:hypothetical protein
MMVCTWGMWSEEIQSWGGDRDQGVMCSVWRAGGVTYLLFIADPRPHYGASGGRGESIVAIGDELIEVRAIGGCQPLVWDVCGS